MVSPFLKVAVVRDDLERAEDARKSSSTLISCLPHFCPLGARPLNCSTLGSGEVLRSSPGMRSSPKLGDVASRPFFRARLRASASERLAAGLLDFSLLSGSVLRPDPPDFATDFAF